MSKKVLIISVVCIVIAIAIVVIVTRPAEKNIDLTALNEQICSKEPFSIIASSDIDKTVANTLFKLEESDIEEIIGKFPLMNVQASMYVVIKAADGKVDKVYNGVVEYGNSYEQQWSRYLPDQHDLVADRKIGKVGNYVYMIISENSSELEALIKK